DILLARMTLLRCLVLLNHVPIKRSVSPCLSLSGGDGYISAVSQKFTPALSAMSICACASLSLFCCPHVIVPKQIFETFSLSCGSVWYCMYLSFLILWQSYFYPTSA